MDGKKGLLEKNDVEERGDSGTAMSGVSDDQLPNGRDAAGDNCACRFLVWSLSRTQAGLANTRTVGYLGGVLGAIDPKIRQFVL